ncbi:cytochrome c biogenesis protein CcdA [Bradyrhizobium sp. LM2.3]
MLELIFALLAGVLTIAAPCTLPMLPILLGASIGRAGHLRPAMIALGFVISFSTTALLLGAITRLFDFDPNVLREAASILLLGFGLLMLWPAPFEWLSIRLNGWLDLGNSNATQREGALGGLLLGTTLGLVWTPCAGPVLGSILTLVATAKNFGWAGTLLVGLRDRRGDSDAGDRLWRAGRDHAGAQPRPHLATASAGLWRRGDRLRPRRLFPIRHADRGVAHRLLSHRPDRPVIIAHLNRRTHP